MPTAALNLTKDSAPDEVKAAIEATITQLVQEGRPQDQAYAIAYAQASKATGEEIQTPRKNSRSLVKEDIATSLVDGMKADGSLYQ